MNDIEATLTEMHARQRATMLAALKYWKREGRRASPGDIAVARSAGPELSGYEIDQLIATVDAVR